MGDFDSVKLGVCDAFWTPVGGSEVFLGLTKGGCDLTYTPEWYNIQVDRYGKSQIDASLVGEAIVVKIPLAETDMRKLEMFAHTRTKVPNTENFNKLTFGRFPGFRLGQFAGLLRLHPIANGSNRAEDVVIYKAVNKAPLDLKYKLDEERIFETEFIGMIKRSNISGAMLWQIGDPSTLDVISLSPTFDFIGLPSNLADVVLGSHGYIWGSPSIGEVTTTGVSQALRTASFRLYTEFNGMAYDITKAGVYTASVTRGVIGNGYPICKGVPVGGTLPVAYPDFNVDTDTCDADDWITVLTGADLGKISARNWLSISTLEVPYIMKDIALNPLVANNWRPVVIGDVVDIGITATWGGLSTLFTLRVTIIA